MSETTLETLTAGLDGTPLAEVVELVRECARGLGCDVFLVGGLVRDLLGARESTDIDLVTTGDVDLLSRSLAASMGRPLTTFPAFRTAKLETASGYRVDLVGARAEEYRFPGSLPTTRPGTLEEDLGRRDFTVNAMAISLLEPASKLIDPHGGRSDLEAGFLRVLHQKSFRDDPTRALRGARFSSELGFGLEPETRALARQPETLTALGNVSGFRIWRELEMALRGGDKARAVVSLLRDLGLEQGLHPSLAADDAVLERLAAATGAGPVRCLTIWAARLDRAARSELAERLALRRSDRRALLAETLPGDG